MFSELLHKRPLNKNLCQDVSTHEKKSMNQAHMENGAFKQIVTHF